MGEINKVIFFGVVIGLILSLSQPFYGWWFLVFPGFILIFLAVKITTWKPGFQVKSFWLGYTVGLIYFLVYFRWFWVVYPLKHLGINSPFLAFFFVFLTWILTAGALALPWGISAGLCKKIDRQISRSALLIFPSVFTILEYLQSYLVGLVWIGQTTPIGPNWTNGNLAYNLHESFLALKLASWFGIYGVTFIIIFLSLLLFIFLEKRKYKNFLILTAAIIALVYISPSRLNLDGDEARKDGPCLSKGRPCADIAIIQTKVPSQASYSSAEEASFFKKQLEMMESIGKNHPQIKLIIFPEESNFFKNLTLFKNTAGANRYFSNLFQGSVLIIDNSKIVANSKFQSKTVFLDSRKGVLGFYDKHLLTPGGEYVPWIFKTMDKILGLNSPAIQNAAEYQTGSRKPEMVASEITAPDGQKLSTTSLICSDIFSPSLSKKAASANVLVSQSSFAFSKGAKDLLSQDLAAAKFRASETDRYLVKASNFGHSYIISSQGLLEKTTSNLDWQILTGSVVLKEKKTLYNKMGNGPILWASLGVLIFSLFLKKYERN